MRESPVKESEIFRTSDGTQWKWIDDQLYLRPLRQDDWVRARTSYDEVRQILFLFENQRES